MTGSEMAEQLEIVAEGARNGNSAGLAVAREMLAHRKLLEALEDAIERLARCARVTGSDDEYIAAMFAPYRDAIAAAKGESNGQ